jgi:hypothetical protein
MQTLAEYLSPFACHTLPLTYKQSRNPINQRSVRLLKETKFSTLQKNRTYSSGMLHCLKFEMTTNSSRKAASLV